MKQENLGLSQQEFEQLIQQAQELPCNEVAFEKLYRKIFESNYKYLEKWLCREVGIRATIDVEDCVQEGFIVFSEMLEKGALVYGNLSAWLKIVIKHIWIKKSKQHKYVSLSLEEVPIIQQISAEMPSFEEIEYKELQHKAYHYAYNTMPKILQTVFDLHIVGSIAHKKIANELNISEDVSRDRVRRAKDYIREKINLFMKDYS